MVSCFISVLSSLIIFTSTCLPGEVFATMFLSWGTAGTLIAGPIVDYLMGSGAGQVFSYRMSFVSAAVLVMVGIVVLAFVNRMEDPRAS